MNPDSKDSLNKSKTARVSFLYAGGAVPCGVFPAPAASIFTYKNLDSRMGNGHAHDLRRHHPAGPGLYKAARKEMKEIMQDKRDRRQLFIFSIFGLMFCQYSYRTAISHSNAGTATVLQYLGPVLIMIVSCFMAKKLPSGREVFAIILAVAGTFLLATHGNIHSLVISNLSAWHGDFYQRWHLMSYTMLPEKNQLGRWGKHRSSPVGRYADRRYFFLFFATRYWTVRVTLIWGRFLARPPRADWKLRPPSPHSRVSVDIGSPSKPHVGVHRNRLQQPLFRSVAGHRL